MYMYLNVFVVIDDFLLNYFKNVLKKLLKNPNEKCNIVNYDFQKCTKNCR